MDYLDYIIDVTKRLLAVPSPTGYTHMATEFVVEELKELGYDPVVTAKGAVLADLGGVEKDNGVLLSAHIDTIGGMVTQVKENGRLKITRVGGMRPQNIEGENCLIHTRSGKAYEGTFQLINPSAHVNTAYGDTPRNYDTMEIVLDEFVNTKAETRALGIRNGDPVSFDPKTVVTSKGFIKSRYLDDKLCVGILLGYAKYLKEENVTPRRSVHALFPTYEEVGHGGASGIPAGITEMIAMDMGCVGLGLEGDETKVSICAKDAFSPYDYDLTSALIRCAEKNDIGHAVDVYTNYSSDADVTLKAGFDIRHGLIGPGVFASHGYERSHLKGAENTFLLLKAYLG